MTHPQRWRRWLNRDDGKHYQIGNRDLTAFEIIGMLLMVSAGAGYLLQDKLGLELEVFTICALMLGGALSYLGIKRNPAYCSSRTDDQV